MPAIISLATAFLTTFACLWLLQPLAIRIGLVDSPEGRKQHQGHIPLIGGISIFAGFLFALLTLSISLLPLRSFIAGCALLVFIGVLDDFHELSPRARFIAQTIAGLMMVLWGKVSLQSFGDLFFLGDIHLSLFSLPITVLAVIGIINAVNMTDGVDGLAGGLAFIELAALLFIALSGSAFTQATIILLIMASLLAFLWFNFRMPWRKQALVFMGDAGSMLLGYSLVWFLTDLSQGSHKLVAPAVMLWLMAIPLFDIAGVVLIRLQKRQSVLQSDREHLHYLLKDLGCSTPQVALILWAAAAIMVCIGIIFAKLHIAEGIIFFSFIGIFAIYLACIRYIRYKINYRPDKNIHRQLS